MLVSANGFVLFLRYGVNKTPHTSRTFLRILLVSIKTVFCSSVIFASIPMVVNLFSRALAGVPRAPTTKDTTVTFIFYILFSYLARSNYFSVFSISLSSTLVSQDIVKSFICYLWCSFSVTIISGLLAVIKLFVCAVKSKGFYKRHSQ